MICLNGKYFKNEFIKTFWNHFWSHFWKKSLREVLLKFVRENWEDFKNFLSIVCKEYLENVTKIIERNLNQFGEYFELELRIWSENLDNFAHFLWYLTLRNVKNRILREILANFDKFCTRIAYKVKRNKESVTQKTNFQRKPKWIGDTNSISSSTGFSIPAPIKSQFKWKYKSNQVILELSYLIIKECLEKRENCDCKWIVSISILCHSIYSGGIKNQIKLN